MAESHALDDCGGGTADALNDDRLVDGHAIGDPAIGGFAAGGIDAVGDDDEVVGRGRGNGVLDIRGGGGPICIWGKRTGSRGIDAMDDEIDWGTGCDAKRVADD